MHARNETHCVLMRNSQCGSSHIYKARAYLARALDFACKHKLNGLDSNILSEQLALTIRRGRSFRTHNVCSAYENLCIWPIREYDMRYILLVVDLSQSTRRLCQMYGEGTHLWSLSGLVRPIYLSMIAYYCFAVG